MVEDERHTVHEWFELSYAQYLTVPRSVLQSMSLEWQDRFTRCLEELDELIDWRPQDGQQYRVTLHEINDGEWGHELDDPFMDYGRGRRRVPWKQRELTYSTVPPDWPDDWGFPHDECPGAKFRVETKEHELVGQWQELKGTLEVDGKLVSTDLVLDYPFEKRADETPNQFLESRCKLLFEFLTRRMGNAAATGLKE